MDAENKNVPSRPEAPTGLFGAKAFWFTLISFLVVGVLGYRLAYLGQVEQTAALFVGLPAILAYVLVWTNPVSHSPYMSMTTFMTMFLLLSSIVLGEGTVCMIFLAPLAYGIGAISTWLYLRVKNEKSHSTRSR